MKPLSLFLLDSSSKLLLKAAGPFMLVTLIGVAGAPSAAAATRNGSARLNRGVAAANSPAATLSKSNAEVMPFTLKTRVYIYAEKDSKQNHEPPRLNVITARSSEGATMTLSYRDGQTLSQARIRSVRYLDGSSVSIYPGLHAVTKWPAQRFAFLNKLVTAPPRDCVEQSWDYLTGYTRMGGVKVAVVKEFPKGSSGMTWWRAPALGCETLQDTLTQVQEDGLFRLVSETKFVSLKLGEPDAALFAVPSDYPNIKPSEALRWWAKRAGRTWDSDLQAQAEREDALYARLEKASTSSKSPK